MLALAVLGGPLAAAPAAPVASVPGVGSPAGDVGRPADGAPRIRVHVADSSGASGDPLIPPETLDAALDPAVVRPVRFAVGTVLIAFLLWAALRR